MLLKFPDSTWIEKPMGSRLVGLKRGGLRPVSVQFDYYDLQTLLKTDHLEKYLVHLWTALAPDRRIDFNMSYEQNRTT